MVQAMRKAPLSRALAKSREARGMRSDWERDTRQVENDQALRLLSTTYICEQLKFWCEVMQDLNS